MNIEYKIQMTSPKILLAANNLRPRKKLGQNFLADPSTAGMIVNRSGLTAEDVIIEIGSGMGALTVPAARQVHRVYAVETDPAIIPILKNEIFLNQLDNVTIQNGSILKFDIDPAFKTAGRKMVVLGNLPYNISSQILVYLIHRRRCIERAIVMLQKELAQRIVADPGVKAYGRLSVMLKYCADIRTVADVKAHLFYPKPKVDSEIIEIHFTHDYGLDEAQELFLFRVIKAAFGQRRKNLKNALSGSDLAIDKISAAEALNQAGIDPLRRAETLQVVEYIRLSECLKLAIDQTVNRNRSE